MPLRLVASKFIHSHHYLLAVLDALLMTVGFGSNLFLDEAVLNAWYHPAHPINPFDNGECLTLDPISQCLDKIRAAQWVGYVCNAGFLREHLLCSQCKLGGLFSRNCKSLIPRGGKDGLDA